MRKLRRLLYLSCSDCILLLESLIWLVISNILIKMIRFRSIAPFLGVHMVQSPDIDSTKNTSQTERISWAVHTVSRHLPIQSKCLVQAICGKAMFKYRGIASTIYLGVAKDDEGELRAHAWLRSGEVIVTGDRGYNQFTVISTFAEKQT